LSIRSWRVAPPRSSSRQSKIPRQFDPVPLVQHRAVSNSLRPYCAGLALCRRQLQLCDWKISRIDRGSFIPALGNSTAIPLCLYHSAGTADCQRGDRALGGGKVLAKAPRILLGACRVGRHFDSLGDVTDGDALIGGKKKKEEEETLN